MLEICKYENVAQTSVTAGPIEDVVWYGITQESRFWSYIEQHLSNGGTIEPYEEPVIDIPRQISKADIWRRCTDVEAELLNDALNSQTVRIQNIFRDAQYISTDDELYPLLLSALTSLLGETRALEILD